MHLVKKRGRNINFNCKVEFIFFSKKIVKKLTAFFGKIIFKEEQIPRTYGVLCVKLKGEFKGKESSFSRRMPYRYRQDGWSTEQYSGSQSWDQS